MIFFATLACLVVLVDAQAVTGIERNPSHPTWGSVGVPQFRLVDDRAVAEGPWTAVSPRLVSNLVCSQHQDNPYQMSPVDGGGANILLMAWGQFIDHDIVLTPTETGEEEEASDLSPCPTGIAVPADDPFFDDPQNPGTVHLPFACSAQPLRNDITAWIDASAVYGSSDEAAALLRDPTTGLMRTEPGSDGRLLPLLSAYSGEEQRVLGMANAAQRHASADLRAAGDVRANENPLLLALHTLMVREHNRIVLHELDGDPLAMWQEARRRVSSIVQCITYGEFLPALHGADPPRLRLDIAEGLYAEHGPDISVEFSSALYRFGHSMIAPSIHRMTGDGLTDVPLRDLFFRKMYTEGAGDPVYELLEGARRTSSHRIDTVIVEEVRSFLFGNGSAHAGRPGMGAGGTDLAAINVQRGRHHLVPSYGALRSALGLEPRVRPEVVGNARLAAAYGEEAVRSGNIDLWVGALAEAPVPGGGRIGELLSVVLGDQFERMRRADPHFEEALDDIGGTCPTLMDVIRRNSVAGRGRAVDGDDAFAMQYDEGIECADRDDSSDGVGEGWRVWGIVAIVLVAVLLIAIGLVYGCMRDRKERPGYTRMRR